MISIAQYRDAKGPFTAFTSLALVALFCSSCSILPKTDPVDVYLLPATQLPPAANAIPLARSLRVARPASDLPVAGQRIAVVPEPNVVSVYKGATWSDAAPVLVRNRLLDAFRADGSISALSSDENSLQADFELQSHLRAFQSEYRSDVPEVVVRLDAVLVQPVSDRIVATRRFEIKQAAKGKNVPDIVVAFGAAGDQLSAQLVSWTLEQITAQNARTAPATP